MRNKKIPKRPPEEPERHDTDLGDAQGAGHPGGEQDLDKKTETEAEHDSFGRHE